MPRELAAEAAPPGGTLRLKIHDRYEVNVVHTARDAVVRADAIGSDHVMSHLGTLTVEEEDVLTPVKEVGDGLGHVHLGEDHRCRRRWDRGFDPVVKVRGYLADGLTRTRTAGVR